MTSVRQPYMFYHPTMHWADPNFDDAVRRLRWVYSHRDDAREKAKAAAAPLRESYAPEAIGELARKRLLDLLKRCDNPRWQQIRATRAQSLVPPPQPLPADWYDADYFEHGIQSNWDDGYNWAAFQGLFRETASFLTAMFPMRRPFSMAAVPKGFS